jgi:hypothetical protein
VLYLHASFVCYGNDGTLALGMLYPLFLEDENKSECINLNVWYFHVPVELAIYVTHFLIFIII